MRQIDLTEHAVKRYWERVDSKASREQIKNHVRCTRQAGRRVRGVIRKLCPHSYSRKWRQRESMGQGRGRHCRVDRNRTCFVVQAMGTNHFLLITCFVLPTVKQLEQQVRDEFLSDIVAVLEWEK